MSVMADNRPGDLTCTAASAARTSSWQVSLVLVVIFFVLTIVRMGPHL